MKTGWKIALALLAGAAIAVAVYTLVGENDGSNINYEVVNPPSMPSGPSAEYAGQTLTYMIEGGSSSKGYDVRYYIDWGDGTFSESNFIVSRSVSAFHIWHSPGTYYVRAQTISASDIISDWSADKEVVISEPVIPTFLVVDRPTGPSTGEVNQTLSYSVNASSDTAGNPEYRFDWGDGSHSSWSSSSDAVNSWSNAGTYTIRAQAKLQGIISNWSIGKEVTISQPEAPPFLTVNTPTGLSAGEVNQILSYSVGISSDVQGSPEYRFDWGDGSYSSWSSSNDASHSWSSTGTYTIKAQAKLPSITSEWSAGKVVVIEQQALSRQPYGQSEQMKRYITPNDPAVKAAVNEILGQQLQVLTDFETMRDWVASHVSYRSDVDVYGVSEYWQLPSETLELHTGDCEDFAILLCSLLRADGVSADQVYVAAGVSEDETLHAYIIEKWYQGIWRVTEPQAGAWLGWFLSDWFTEVSYETLYCFNDQDCFEGPPTLPSGAYEFQLSFIGGASALFERYMNSGQTITASVEWLPMHGQLPDFSIFGWGLKIYNASGNTVFSWFGGDLQRSFSFAVATSGKYKVEVYIGGFLPSSARLTMDPPDWSGQ